MDIQKIMDNAVKAKRAESFKDSTQLTLGEIISKLEAIPEREDDEATVCFDFEYLRPTSLDSWRGSYNELALGFSDDGQEPKLSDFIKHLKDAVGKEYEGYKGGEYTMSRHTPVWVANHGNAGSTSIVDILNNGYEVILITGRTEY